MTESTKPKYASLPGIDTSPDIYETPELTEDVSTIPASTATSSSDNDDEDDEAEGPERSTVQTQRLRPDQARSRFRPSRIDARGVDFSDNISAPRQSYRTSTDSRPQRDAVLAYHSDDDEAEIFGKKLNRVQRDLEFLEQEYDERIRAGEDRVVEEIDHKKYLDELTNRFEEMLVKRKGARGAEAQLEKVVQKFDAYEPFAPSAAITKAIKNQPPLPGTQIQRNQLNYVLDQAADFDKRLTQLENSLGLNGNNMPELSARPAPPILSTIQRLDQTVTVISDSSNGSLGSMTEQIKQLTADAERLKETRAEATRAGAVLAETHDTLHPDQEVKINALYGTLPALDRLAPLLPMVLDTLHSLRLIHTGAFESDAALDMLSKEQARQEEEIEYWDAQLKEMENKIKITEKAMQRDVKGIGESVRGLEERIEKLLGDN